MVKKYLVLALVILMATSCFAVDRFFIIVKDRVTRAGIADAKVEYQQKIVDMSEFVSGSAHDWITAVEMITGGGILEGAIGEILFPIVGSRRSRFSVPSSPAAPLYRTKISKPGYDTIYGNTYRETPLNARAEDFDEYSESDDVGRGIFFLTPSSPIGEGGESERGTPARERITLPSMTTTTTTLRRMEVPGVTTTTRGFRKFRRF